MDEMGVEKVPMIYVQNMSPINAKTKIMNLIIFEIMAGCDFTSCYIFMVRLLDKYIPADICSTIHRGRKWKRKTQVMF
jgi:hypothetical protein